MNVLIHEIIANDWAEKAAEICGVPAEQIQEAAHILGSAEQLLSSARQGVYQSHQASATAVQINTVNLIRRMLGKPATYG
jgi:ferredoxin-nitrate reductase